MIFPFFLKILRIQKFSQYRKPNVIPAHVTLHAKNCVTNLTTLNLTIILYSDAENTTVVKFRKSHSDNWTVRDLRKL